MFVCRREVGTREVMTSPTTSPICAIALIILVRTKRVLIVFQVIENIIGSVMFRRMWLPASL
jgi:hypothetical protein